MNGPTEIPLWQAAWEWLVVHVTPVDGTAALIVLVVMLIGLKHGLAGELARIGALAAALAAAWFLADPAAAWMAEHTRLAPETARITAFVGIALVAWLVAGLVRYGLRNLLEIQFKGPMNRMGGLLVGGLKGAAMVYLMGAALLLIPAFRAPESWLVTSRTGGWILRTFPDLYAKTVETFPDLRSPRVEEVFGPPDADPEAWDVPPDDAPDP
jgi:uncharacterized membrane protein required for colicin V production